MIYLTTDNWETVARRLGPDSGDIVTDPIAWLYYMIAECREAKYDGFSIHPNSGTFLDPIKKMCVKLGFCKE